jgi:hypothetical protein
LRSLFDGLQFAQLGVLEKAQITLNEHIAPVERDLMVSSDDFCALSILTVANFKNDRSAPHLAVVHLWALQLSKHTNSWYEVLLCRAAVVCRFRNVFHIESRRFIPLH